MADKELQHGLGQARQVPIASLRLDAQNPRLPTSMQGRSQEDLAVDLDLGFEALTVADSIANNGFFHSEPLIVIPAEDEKGAWTVVEGNRRLTALLGLTRPDIRKQFPDPERWEELATRAGLTGEMKVPVVVAPSRASVVPIIGFRHISGILAWTPYAQARYVAKLVDEDGMSIADVARMIGIERTRAGNLYRDQAIAKQARELGIETGPVESAFSLLTVAMNNTRLRDHIAAPLGSRLQPGETPIPVERAPELREVLVWVFGDGETAPLIADSREMSKLGNVVGSDVGLGAIRAGSSLAQAQQKIEEAGLDTRQRLSKRLGAARNALTAAAEDIGEHADDEAITELLEEIRDALEALESATGD